MTESNNCKGRTKKGAPCKKNAKYGDYCLVHSEIRSAEPAIVEVTASEPLIAGQSTTKMTSSEPLDSAGPVTTEVTRAEHRVSKPISFEADIEKTGLSIEDNDRLETFIRVGDNLIMGLDKTIEYIPSVVDTMFTFSGAKFMMPAFSEKMQKTASNKSLEALNKIQGEIKKLSEKPELQEQMIKQIGHLEKISHSLLLIGGKYAPVHLKEELINAFNELQTLRKKMGIPGPKAYMKKGKKFMKTGRS